MNKTTILVVEDDRPIRNLIITTLKTHDYKYLAAENGAAALLEASSHNPDIVLLDLGLPDMEGVEIIKKIRTWSNMPIIVISARSEDTDKIEALDAGADDYITKPFSVEELLARIRVTQRRLSIIQAGDSQETSLFQNGNLKIDYTAGCTYLKDTELHLTPIEYKLLCLLSHNLGKVLTHTYITQQIWGRTSENDVASLRVFMATLRKKLQPDKNGVQYIDGSEPETEADGSMIENYMMDDGSLEYHMILKSHEKGFFTGKQLHVELENLGTVAKAQYFPDIEGNWILDMTLGGADTARYIETCEKLGDTETIVTGVELSPVSMRVTYDFPKTEPRMEEFEDENGEIQTIAWPAQPPFAFGIRLKDGTVMKYISAGSESTGYTSEEGQEYVVSFPLDRVIDPDQVEAVLFREYDEESDEHLTYEVPLKAN